MKKFLKIMKDEARRKKYCPSTPTGIVNMKT